MSTLRDLARDAVEELRRTQWTVGLEYLDNGAVCDVDICLSCGKSGVGPNGKAGHLCPRTLLIADLEAALRVDR